MQEKQKTLQLISSLLYFVHMLCYLGLENIHALTNTSTKYEVRFDLGLGSERAYAVYDEFKLGSAKQKFKLTIGNYKGNAGRTDTKYNS